LIIDISLEDFTLQTLCIIFWRVLRHIAKNRNSANKVHLYAYNMVYPTSLLGTIVLKASSNGP